MRSAAIGATGFFTLLAMVLFAGANGARAQSTAGNALACPNEIPVGVRIVKVPAADQAKVSISGFALSPSKDGQTYDLSMRLKNQTENWCITSLAIAFSFGDARGQEWQANEYPAVKNFTSTPPAPPGSAPPAAQGKKPPRALPAHSVGLSPGQDEGRMLFDVYDYIQPRPETPFDGFHLISAQIKTCMGYILEKPK